MTKPGLRLESDSEGKEVCAWCGGLGDGSGREDRTPGAGTACMKVLVLGGSMQKTEGP